MARQIFAYELQGSARSSPDHQALDAYDSNYGRYTDLPVDPASRAQPKGVSPFVTKAAPARETASPIFKPVGGG